MKAHALMVNEISGNSDEALEKNSLSFLLQI